MVKKTQSGSEWLRNTWRPLMSILYLGVCAADFIIFPALWPSLQAYMGNELTQWSPTTLQEGALFHVAMGAILGISAWTRGSEKIELNRNKNDASE